MFFSLLCQRGLFDLFCLRAFRFLQCVEFARGFIALLRRKAQAFVQHGDLARARRVFAFERGARAAPLRELRAQFLSLAAQLREPRGSVLHLGAARIQNLARVFLARRHLLRDVLGARPLKRIPGSQAVVERFHDAVIVACAFRLTRERRQARRDFVDDVVNAHKILLRLG